MIHCYDEGVDVVLITLQDAFLYASFYYNHVLEYRTGDRNNIILVNRVVYLDKLKTILMTYYRQSYNSANEDELLRLQPLWKG